MRFNIVSRIHTFKESHLENTKLFGRKTWDICFCEMKIDAWSSNVSFLFSFSLCCFNILSIWVNQMLGGTLAVWMSSYSYSCVHIKSSTRWLINEKEFLKWKNGFILRVEAQGRLNDRQFSAFSVFLYILITHQHFFPHAIVFSHVW